MRDLVTHFSDLEDLSCFQIKQSKGTDLIVRVYYPSMPSGERVSKYGQSVEQNCFDDPGMWSHPNQSRKKLLK